MTPRPIRPTVKTRSSTMGSSSLPSPPAEDHKSTLSRKSTSSAKSVKPVHRASKRASSSAAAIHHHDHVTHTAGMDGRHKRVWKACERCRMKKTKVCLVNSECVPPLTRSSATVNSPASDARMTVWYAPPVLERRWNTSNCLEGMCGRSLPGSTRHLHMPQIRRGAREHPIRPHRHCPQALLHGPE
jgi:hypothetical protein